MTADRLWKGNSATRSHFNEHILFDAGHIVGMLHGSFPPCGHFYRMNEFGVHVEQRQFRRASNRIAWVNSVNMAALSTIATPEILGLPLP